MKKIIENSKLNELFGGPFELIDSGFSTGQQNMDFDMLRTTDCSKGNALPMFRLYGWKPWSVSLGANQKEEDINKEECSKRNIDLVRRPTGGRAVLHANEITYSVVLKLPANMTVHDIYRDIHIALMNGLNKLGIPEENRLEFEKSQPNFKDLYQNSDKSVACFASSARYEISHENRKIVGSAQRLFGTTLLQHGSILLGPGHEQLAFVTKTQEEAKQKALLKFILSHSAAIGEIAGRDISYNEAANALIEEIEKR